MLDGADVEYSYDGTLDGFFCCVFESISKKEFPTAIYSPADMQMSLIRPKEIETEAVKAARVRSSIPKIHSEALIFVQKAFCTCLENKEIHILNFLRMGYKLGAKVMYMLADDTVSILNKAVRHLESEAHLYLGFVRFSIFDGAMTAQIEPKNFVLPMLVRHFCSRYPEEHFMIYDKTHSAALIYEPYSCKIIPAEQLTAPTPDEDELKYRKLWKMFYNTIEVEDRHNPKCRMTQMPKRYWKEMTEFW